MRDHLHFASARRDDRLARIRKLTLWVGGAAAAASLGLGTAFAHAVPGHSATSPTSSPAKATAGAGSSGGVGRSGGPTAASSASTGTHPRHHHKALAQP